MNLSNPQDRKANLLYIKSILNYDPNTGSFMWIMGKQSIKVNSIAGRLNLCGYIQIGINRKRYYAHRLAWLYMTGEWPENEIDHIDMNRSNNKWDNLRLATRSENARNTIKHKDNTSGFKGVSWHKATNKWSVRIKYKDKNIWLGLYITIEDAINAYEKACKLYHGEFARIE